MSTAPSTTDTLARIADTLATRRPDRGGDPQTSYSAKLLAKGPDAFLKKIGEEATELVMAAKDAVPERIISETADLWFHCLVNRSEERRVGKEGVSTCRSRRSPLH